MKEELHGVTTDECDTIPSLGDPPDVCRLFRRLRIGIQDGSGFRKGDCGWCAWRPICRSFEPQDRSQPSSIGVTQADGTYKLRCSSGEDGAAIGQHIVRVTAVETDDPAGPPLTIPEKYNTQFAIEFRGQGGGEHDRSAGHAAVAQTWQAHRLTAGQRPGVGSPSLDATLVRRGGFGTRLNERVGRCPRG